MEVNIIFFGPIKDLTGRANLVMQDVPDTEKLLGILAKEFPAISGARFVLAVDKTIIQKNTTLNHNCTVALMPAFSGG